jgi:polar amino acid transport system substrate-binding protein
MPVSVSVSMPVPVPMPLPMPLPLPLPRDASELSARSDRVRRCDAGTIGVRLAAHGVSMGSSRILVAAALVTATLVASVTASGAPSPRTSPGPTPADCRKAVKTEVVTKGKLTVATNNPALAPWFVNDNPGNGKGYEAGVAYDLGAVLGFKTTAVTWYTEPFELAEAAGAKPFDFDINEITYNPKLAKQVTFSIGYFTVNQSMVALKTDKIVSHHTVKELRHYLYGALSGSPGLSFIRNQIHPVTPPTAYATVPVALAALSAHKIDALVIDTPSGHYLVSQQLKNGDQFAQFHTSGQYYALVLQENNPLVACVDTAIRTLRKNGDLSGLSKKNLKVYNSIPFIKP